MLCRHLEVSDSGYYDWEWRHCCPGPGAMKKRRWSKRLARFIPAADRPMALRATPGTVYNLQARAIGGSTGYSDWSDPFRT